VLDQKNPSKPRILKNGTRWRFVGLTVVVLILVQYAGHLHGFVARDQSPASPIEDARAQAAWLAQQLVPKHMRDPSSAAFGHVWGINQYVACGYVNGRNGFGGMTGQQGFIMDGDLVLFEDGSSAFAKRWNTTCLIKPTGKVPTGVLGREWGSRPSHGMTLAGRKTSDDLAVYRAGSDVTIFDGIAIQEAAFSYDHGRLFGVDLFFAGAANRDSVKAFLAKTYGPPTSYDPRVPLYRWRWPLQSISITLSWQESSATATLNIQKEK
jgi:hypothetical protein